MQAILKSKAILLLKRERELLSMRRAKSRALEWLTAVHKLYKQVTPSANLEVISDLWADILLRDLGFQAAGCFLIDPATKLLHPVVWLTPSGAPIDDELLKQPVNDHMVQGSTDQLSNWTEVSHLLGL